MKRHILIYGDTCNITAYNFAFFCQESCSDSSVDTRGSTGDSCTKGLTFIPLAQVEGTSPQESQEYTPEQRWPANLLTSRKMVDSDVLELQDAAGVRQILAEDRIRSIEYRISCEDM